ncbi:hypothetical protein ACN23B_22365 [Anabaena sp. FACHB-709]|nr:MULTISPECIES: hypothetical protein [Nostocaceae]
MKKSLRTSALTTLREAEASTALICVKKLKFSAALSRNLRF